jgi:Flp pilus assembly protein TadG
MADEAGTAAVEFAMVLPAFAVLIVGGVWTAQLMFETSSLHYAVEAAARCAAVNSVTCSSTTAIQTYAASKYYGPSYPAPTFVSTTGACGQAVTGTVTYVLNTGVTSISIPLSATACFA